MIRLALLCLFLSSAYLSQSQKSKEAAPYKSDTVFVKGLLDAPLALTTGNLAGITIQTKAAHNVTCESGEVKKSIPGFKGILLKDILKKAGVQMDSKKEQGKYFVVVTATDGYQVIFAYDELMYGPAATGAFLLWEESGKAITEDGPFIVLCTSDTASGPRHVKWVRDIEVRKI